MGTIMGTPFFIAPSDVFARLGRADAPLIFDVRRPEIVAASDTMMPIARFRAPSEAVVEGRAEQSGRAVLVACAHGHNRSQQVVARLRSVGVDASAIAGGYDGWQAAGLPLVKRTARGVSLGAAPTVWVTRRRPKIDRVACPWLINRFLDAQAAFLFVEPDQVLAVGEEVGGVAYDLPGAAFEHDGELCTFDTLLAAFALDADPVLCDLASIVRAPIPPGSISRRNAPGCWPSRSACRRSTATTIMPSCVTAFRSMMRCMRGCSMRARSAITGLARPRRLQEFSA